MEHPAEYVLSTLGWRKSFLYPLSLGSQILTAAEYLGPEKSVPTFARLLQSRHPPLLPSYQSLYKI